MMVVIMMVVFQYMLERLICTQDCSKNISSSSGWGEWRGPKLSRGLCGQLLDLGLLVSISSTTDPIQTHHMTSRWCLLLLGGRASGSRMGTTALRRSLCRWRWTRRKTSAFSLIISTRTPCWQLYCQTHAYYLVIVYDSYYWSSKLCPL